MTFYSIGNSGERYITASHAIFYTSQENEAPGVVVGYEMAYNNFRSLIEKVIGINFILVSTFGNLLHVCISLTAFKISQ